MRTNFHTNKLICLLWLFFQTMQGEWQPPESSEVQQPPRDNPVVGHVVQRLFNIVYPPTVSKTNSFKGLKGHRIKRFTELLAKSFKPHLKLISIHNCLYYVHSFLH